MALTLLETMLALAIFSISVVGLLFAIQVCLDASRSMKREAQIRQQLESRLARLSLPDVKEYSNKQIENGITYEEEIRREQVNNGQLAIIPGFWKISVRAEWKEGGEKKSWSASHLLWNP